MDGDATNAPIPTSRNNLKRKYTTAPPVNMAGAATQSVKYAERHTVEKIKANDTHQRSTEPLLKKCKVDHAILQEVDEDADEATDEEADYGSDESTDEEANNGAGDESDEEETRPAPLSLPTFSLAHKGRFSARSLVRWFTVESNHKANMMAIMQEEDGAFICRMNIKVAETAESCDGVCIIPHAEIDSRLAEYYRTLPNDAKRLELGEVCNIDALSGLVRLGRVTGEDEMPGTYTCEAEFGQFDAVNPWKAEVYVPKKHVPGYKLVDWEGEQNPVASIETSSEESKDQEHAPAQRHTVQFSRFIEEHREQMSIELWSADGERLRTAAGVQILAYELEGPHIYLEFRMRHREASWWHFHGRMHRGLRHGRFDASSSPFSNIQSDAHFGMGWIDRSIESDTSRKIQELWERIQSDISGFRERFMKQL